MQDTITLGISPCPNDTYIFHALLHGFVDIPFNIHCIMADVQELNLRASKGELDATKLSVGALPNVYSQYSVLHSGAALGFSCGPLLISKEKLDLSAQNKASIAIPGKMTTAALLLNLHGQFQGSQHEMVFDEIIPSVLEGKVDMGLIIHEGRFTYADLGLHKVIDLGQWWEEKYHMPLPLGAIAVKRSLPREISLALENGITQSINFARKNPEASKTFITNHAQELAEDVVNAHIKTYVNDFSLNLGDIGRESIEKLLSAQDLFNKNIVPKNKSLAELNLFFE